MGVWGLVGVGLGGCWSGVCEKLKFWGICVFADYFILDWLKMWILAKQAIRT